MAIREDVWTCSYCQESNSANGTFCSGCGAPYDLANAREAGFPPPRVKKGYGRVFLGAIALLVLMVLLVSPKSTTLTVTGYYWQRTVLVKKRRPVIEQAWEGQVPSSARVLGSRRELHGASRGLARYQNRVTYEINRWLPDHEVHAGGLGHAAAWPDFRVGADEWKVGHTELYQVFFQTAEGETAFYEAPDEQVWKSFGMGRTYQGKVYRDGRVAEVRTR